MGFRAFVSCKLSATFARESGEFLAQAVTSFADFFAVKVCIDIHCGLEIGVPQHTLQNLRRNVATIRRDGRVTVPELVCGEPVFNARLLQNLDERIPTTAVLRLAERFAV